MIMFFNIVDIIDLLPEKQSIIHIGNEPNNDLVQYFKDGDFLRNRSDRIVRNNYSELILNDEAPRFTRRRISRFGIKSAVGIGAYGFYQDVQDEFGYVKVPINYVHGYEPPHFTVWQTETKILFDITNPETIEYECFRLTFRQGLFAYEFITYDFKGELEKPFEMEGEHFVTCIGYMREVQVFSQPMSMGIIDIIKRTDAPGGGKFVRFPDMENAINKHDLSKEAHEYIQRIFIDEVTETLRRIMEAPIGDLPDFYIPPTIVVPATPVFLNASVSSEFGTGWGLANLLGTGTWFSSSGVQTAWLRFNYSWDSLAIRYLIRTRHDQNTANIPTGPSVWTLIGIKDDERIIIDTRNAEVFAGNQLREFTIQNNPTHQMFSSYELNITNTFGATHVGISHFEIIFEVPGTVI